MRTVRNGQVPAPARTGGSRHPDRLTSLSKVDIFDGLSEAELRRCEQELPMMRAPAGRILFTPASAEQVLFIVKEGSVRLYRLSGDGRELTLGVLQAGAVFGTLPMFGSLSRNTFGEAVDDTLVCLMSETHLAELVSRHPQIAMRLLRRVGERLAAAEDQLEDLAFRSAEQRVTRCVLRMLGERGARRLSVSHEEIAKTAGVARETVTKILGTLERRGVVATGYRRLEVVDLESLQVCAAD